MNCLQVTESNFNSYFSAWENFVQLHPKGSIFQSPHYFSVFSTNKNTRPVAFLMLDNDEKVKGVLVSIIQYQLFSVFRFLSSRAVCTGGPLAENDNPEVTTILLDAFNKFIQGKTIYSQFRNLHDISVFTKLFTDQGYLYEEHLNIHIDLSKDEAQLWKEMHTKRRNEIRKAEKEGLTMELIENPDKFSQSLEIIKRLYKTIKLPVYDQKVFENVFSQLVPKGLALLYGVFYKKELIGTMYCFSYKGVIYDWFAGSRKEYYAKYPNDFLPWKIFLWTKEKGYNTFDWGGAGKPGIPYGVREYKSKFGGTFVNFGRFEKIHNKPLFYLAKVGFKVWQLLKVNN